MLRPTVEHGCSIGSLGIDRGVESEFGGEHHLVTDWRQCLTHQLFVSKGAIHLCRIKEGDTPLHGATDEGDHLLFVFRGTVGKAHPHAAESEG